MSEHWIKNKVAIVAGGASGIGQAIAIEASRNGATVVIADIDVEEGNSTVQKIRKENNNATFIKTDVTNLISVAELVQQAKKIGPIKYLACSAGIQTYGTVETTSLDDWEKCMDVNLKSMFLLSKIILPEMRSNGGGGIVNISSIQGLRCQKNVLAYATSKGAVIAMTRAMGIDHARENISVNCICPGSVDTPMLRYGADKHGDTETVLAEWAEHHPIGRIGTPMEIAKTTMFLWSPDSNFIVGHAVIADGGLGSVIL